MMYMEISNLCFQMVLLCRGTAVLSTERTVLTLTQQSKVPYGNGLLGGAILFCA